MTLAADRIPDSPGLVIAMARAASYRRIPFFHRTPITQDAWKIPKR
jgi:hypothetical protein